MNLSTHLMHKAVLYYLIYHILKTKILIFLQHALGRIH
jgi:hypothetical protein